MLGERLTAILLVVAWVAVATYGDVKFKEARAVMSAEFALGFASYAASTLFALATFRVAQWGWVFIAWNLLSLALGLVLAVLVFHEPFTARRAISAALLVAAMLLTE